MTPEQSHQRLPADMVSAWFPHHLTIAIVAPRLATSVSSWNYEHHLP